MPETDRLTRVINIAVGGTSEYVKGLSDDPSVDPDYLLGCLDCIPIVKEMADVDMDDEYAMMTSLLSITSRLTEGFADGERTQYLRGRMSFVRMFTELMFIVE